MPDDKLFGRRLEEIRKRRGLSQVKVAQRLAIHQSLISQYERGYVRLHGALLVRLAQILKTTPDEILALNAADNGDPHTIDRRFLRRLQRTSSPPPRQEAPPRHHRRLPREDLLKVHRTRKRPSAP